MAKNIGLPGDFSDKLEKLADLLDDINTSAGKSAGRTGPINFNNPTPDNTPNSNVNLRAASNPLLGSYSGSQMHISSDASKGLELMDMGFVNKELLELGDAIRARIQKEAGGRFRTTSEGYRNQFTTKSINLENLGSLGQRKILAETLESMKLDFISKPTGRDEQGESIYRDEQEQQKAKELLNDYLKISFSDSAPRRPKATMDIGIDPSSQLYKDFVKPQLRMIAGNAGSIKTRPDTGLPYIEFIQGAKSAYQQEDKTYNDVEDDIKTVLESSKDISSAQGLPDVGEYYKQAGVEHGGEAIMPFSSWKQSQEKRAKRAETKSFVNDVFGDDLRGNLDKATDFELGIYKNLAHLAARYKITGDEYDIQQVLAENKFDTKQMQQAANWNVVVQRAIEAGYTVGDDPNAVYNGAIRYAAERSLVSGVSGGIPTVISQDVKRERIKMLSGEEAADPEYMNAMYDINYRKRKSKRAWQERVLGDEKNMDDEAVAYRERKKNRQERKEMRGAGRVGRTLRKLGVSAKTAGKIGRVFGRAGAAAIIVAAIVAGVKMIFGILNKINKTITDLGAASLTRVGGRELTGVSLQDQTLYEGFAAYTKNLGDKGFGVIDFNDFNQSVAQKFGNLIADEGKGLSSGAQNAAALYKAANRGGSEGVDAIMQYALKKNLDSSYVTNDAVATAFLGMSRNSSLWGANSSVSEYAGYLKGGYHIDDRQFRSFWAMLNSTPEYKGLVEEQLKLFELGTEGKFDEGGISATEFVQNIMKHITPSAYAQQDFRTDALEQAIREMALASAGTKTSFESAFTTLKEILSGAFGDRFISAMDMFNKGLFNFIYGLSKTWFGKDIDLSDYILGENKNAEETLRQNIANFDAFSSAQRQGAMAFYREAFDIPEYISDKTIMPLVEERIAEFGQGSSFGAGFMPSSIKTEEQKILFTTAMSAWEVARRADNRKAEMQAKLENTNFATGDKLLTTGFEGATPTSDTLRVAGTYKANSANRGDALLTNFLKDITSLNDAGVKLPDTIKEFVGKTTEGVLAHPNLIRLLPDATEAFYSSISYRKRKAGLSPERYQESIAGYDAYNLPLYAKQLVAILDTYDGTIYNSQEYIKRLPVFAGTGNTEFDRTSAAQMANIFTDAITNIQNLMPAEPTKMELDGAFKDISLKIVLDNKTGLGVSVIGNTTTPVDYISVSSGNAYKGGNK